MNFRIVIPYYGNEPKYQKLLEDWFKQYDRTFNKASVTIATDAFTKLSPARNNFVRFVTPERTQFHFDHKAALVCAAIQHFTEPLLVLDSDALVRLPLERFLAPLEYVPFAMPEDEGARGRFLRNRHRQETDINKRCAGVLWFGSGQRIQLAAEYTDAFQTLLTNKYAEERRLYEQHAWSMVAYKRNAPFLPRELNWPDHITSVGRNDRAGIYHRIGQRKFGVAFDSSVT